MLSIRTMNAADVPLGMHLKDAAGWNQTEADWRRLLALEPAGCFVAESDGRPVATTCVTVFPPVGWVSMVLVDPPARGRGIATRLMEHALACLDGRGVRSVRLDATPLGRAAYERLGFVAEYEVARWEGEARAGRPAPGIAAAGPGDVEAIAAIDAEAAGTGRSRLLARLREERPDALMALTAGGRIVGYACVRPGTRASQVGPVVAVESGAGETLADAALSACAGGRVFADVPVPNAAAMRWAEARGLRVQRRFTRMRRGDAVPDRPERLWAGFGPEKG
jgi:predicted N-acetyltransferase YhbS